MQKEHSDPSQIEFINMTKSTNQQLLDLLLPKAVSEAEEQQILSFVEGKNAFSKKQSLFLTMVAARTLIETPSQAVNG
jgi:hypothetical protein